MAVNEDELFDFVEAVFGRGRTKHDIRVVMARGVNQETLSSRDADEIVAHVEAYVARMYGAFVSLATRAAGEASEVAAVCMYVEPEKLPATMASEFSPSIVLKHDVRLYGVWLINDPVEIDDPQLMAICAETGTARDALVPLPGTPGVEVLHHDGECIYRMEELYDFFVGYEAPTAADAVGSADVVDPDIIPDDWQAVLAFGPGKDGKPGTWEPKPLALAHLISGLTTHRIGAKDGPAFLQGSNFGKARTAKSMEKISIIGVDVDNGMPSAEIDAILKARGLFAIRYTTHSHGKAHTDVKKDQWVKWQKENPKGTPSDYLVHVKGYLPHVVVGADITDTMGKADGLYVRITHAPMDKNRIIFVLKEPWNVNAYETQDDGIKAWKRAYAAFCQWLGDIPYDESCIDPSRLFYLPRHDKDAPHEAVVHQGRAVDIFTLPPARYVPGLDRGKRGAANVFEQAAAEMGATQVAPSMQVIRSWAARGFADRFLIVDAIEENTPEMLRPEFDKKFGLKHIECPFESEHTSDGGSGTFIMNAGDTDNGGFTVKCMHASCVDRDRLDFVEEMLDVGWLKAEDLTDERFLIEIEDEPEVPLTTKSEAVSAEPTVVESAVLTAVEIEKALKRLVDKNLSEMQAKAEIAKLAKKAEGLTKTDIQKQYDRLVRQKKALQQQIKDESAKDRRVFYVANDFRKVADDTMKTLMDANDPPSIFKFDNDLARVIRSDDGQVQIEPLDNASLRHEVSRISRWLQPLGEDMVEVAPPRDVIEDVMSVPAHKKPFPVLVSVVGTPVFSKSGKLHATPGYDPESQTYYQPLDGFELLPVSPKPSAEEVQKARDLLEKEVLIDFPFDGNAEKAHAIAMILLPFVRNMIDGPTPIHWIDKPSPGTGASKLVNVVSLLAVGAQADPITEESREEEWKKKITSVLKTGQPIFFIDNVNGKLDSAALATMTTAPRWKDRALGSNATVNVPVRCTVIIAGNNVQMSSELIRRAARCRLDAKIDKPASRTKFRHADLEAWVIENRSELVWACLTLVQNWIAQNSPKFHDVILNSFENWSRVLGGILHAAGIPGFLANKDAVQEANDEETQTIRAFLSVWWGHHEGKEVTIKGESDYDEHSLFALAQEIDPPLPLLSPTDQGKRIRLGNYLMKLVGRWFEVETEQGKLLVCVAEAGTDTKTRAKKWRLDSKPPQHEV